MGTGMRIIGALASVASVTMTIAVVLAVVLTLIIITVVSTAYSPSRRIPHARFTK